MTRRGTAFGTGVAMANSGGLKSVYTAAMSNAKWLLVPILAVLAVSVARLSGMF